MTKHSNYPEMLPTTLPLGTIERFTNACPPGVSRSAFLRELILDFLDRLDNENPAPDWPQKPE